MLSESFSDAWKVLGVFLIPFGGGIPAGVVLARKLGMEWPLTTFLYFISDVILACLFEPLMFAVIALAQLYNSRLVANIQVAFQKSVKKAMSHYGHSTGPFALIMIAFGVDPMTGRAAAKVAGHGFIGGWMIAIAGDMIYFAVLLVSTLWLNDILGDGTWTILIILIFMMIFPILLRRIRIYFRSTPQ